MCEFQSLFFGDDGYVVRCPKCGMYQLAYASTMLTISEKDFEILCKIVKHKISVEDHSVYNKSSKSITIPTLAQGVYILLTSTELVRFNEILEEADNEAKALSLINLFNS